MLLRFRGRCALVGLANHARASSSALSVAAAVPPPALDAIDPQIGTAARKVFRTWGRWTFGGVGGTAVLAACLAEAGQLHSPVLVSAAMCGGALAVLSPLGFLRGGFDAAEHVAVRQRVTAAAAAAAWRSSWGAANAMGGGGGGGGGAGSAAVGTAAAAGGAAAAAVPLPGASISLEKLRETLSLFESNAEVFVGREGNAAMAHGSGISGISGIGGSGGRLAVRSVMGVMSLVMPAQEAVVRHVADRCAELAEAGQTAVRYAEAEGIVSGAAEAFVAAHIEDKRETATGLGLLLFGLGAGGLLAADRAWGEAARRVEAKKQAARDKVQGAADDVRGAGRRALGMLKALGGGGDGGDDGGGGGRS